MRTRYYTATSIDGFIADEHHSLDWLLRFGDGGGAAYDRFIAEVGAVIMGSTTYDWILDHDLLADPSAVKPWPYSQPTWVLTSRTLRTVPGADVRFVSGEVEALHAEIERAAGGRDLWIVGGGDVAGQFADAGMLDELLLFVTPVALGAGAPLLPRRLTDPPLRLLEARVDGPFAALRYAVER